MIEELEDNYDFVCKKFDVSLYVSRERLSITVNWVAPRYNHTGELLHISSPNVTMIRANRIDLGDKRNFNYHDYSLRLTNYTYEDVIQEFEKLVAQIKQKR